MSLQKVTAYFSELGIQHRIMEFDVSSATVELASIALGVEPGRIAKSLSFDVKGTTVIIVTAGDRKIDNAGFRAFFHTKAKMLTGQEVSERTGHAIGGVCPFAVNEGVKVYLDESLKVYKSVFPACGSSNSAIEVSIPELEQYSRHCGWVNVCKPLTSVPSALPEQ